MRSLYIFELWRCYSHNLINKEVLLEEVKAAKELANRNEPSDKQHLTKKLGNLLSGTADVAQICQLVWQIISTFNTPIASS